MRSWGVETEGRLCPRPPCPCPPCPRPLCPRPPCPHPPCPRLPCPLLVARLGRGGVTLGPFADSDAGPLPTLLPRQEGWVLREIFLLAELLALTQTHNPSCSRSLLSQPILRALLRVEPLIVLGVGRSAAPWAPASSRVISIMKSREAWPWKLAPETAGAPQPRASCFSPPGSVWARWPGGGLSKDTLASLPGIRTLVGGQVRMCP